MTAFAAQRQDLSTVRFAWSPVWETLHAARMFIDPRGRPYHQTWHAAMAGEAARLDRPASTGTLAALHGLSPSGTSKHLIAMRDAGLITGTRYGHEIRYARTRLGTDLSRAAAVGD